MNNCTEIALPPSQNDGEHVFCTTCIKQWMSDCTETPTIDETSVIQRVLSYKDVMCFQEECKLYHSLSECPFEKIKCEHEGCDEVLERQKMYEHQQVCNFRLILCDYCKKAKVAFKDLYVCLLRKTNIVRIIKKIVKLNVNVEKHSQETPSLRNIRKTNAH